LLRTENSTSAIFNQLACRCVAWNSSSRRMRRASCGRKCLVERGRRVRVQIVEHHPDHFRVGGK
jgi:hypothetical protein